jgi:hypothetical protein
MTDNRDVLQAEIERNRDALSEKVHQLENRVLETKDRVVHAVDVRSRYRRQPWRFVLAALTAGVVTACWSTRSEQRGGSLTQR